TEDRKTEAEEREEKSEPMMPAVLAGHIGDQPAPPALRYSSSAFCLLLSSLCFLGCLLFHSSAVQFPLPPLLLPAPLPPPPASMLRAFVAMASLGRCSRADSNCWPASLRRPMLAYM